MVYVFVKQHLQQLVTGSPVQEEQHWPGHDLPITKSAAATRMYVAEAAHSKHTTKKTAATNHMI